MQAGTAFLELEAVSPRAFQRPHYQSADGNYSTAHQLTACAALFPHTGMSLRAEFNVSLRALAKTLGIPHLATANEIFGLFDGSNEGILHVRELAAGLAVLCGGCMARSVLHASLLYCGADGNMGFGEISCFTTPIFKVCYIIVVLEDFRWN